MTKQRFVDNARAGGNASGWSPRPERADQLVGLLADYNYSSLRYYGEDGVVDLEQGGGDSAGARAVAELGVGLAHAAVHDHGQPGRLGDPLASSDSMPSWSHSTLAPIAAASLAISGVSSEGRNTSTTSTGWLTSASERATGSPNSSPPRAAVHQDDPVALTPEVARDPVGRLGPVAEGANDRDRGGVGEDQGGRSRSAASITRGSRPGRPPGPGAPHLGAGVDRLDEQVAEQLVGVGDAGVGDAHGGVADDGGGGLGAEALWPRSARRGQR